MTRPVGAYEQINIRLLPFEDHCWIYLEHHARGSGPRGLGRVRSYRLDLSMDQIDLDNPNALLAAISDAVSRRLL